MNKLRHTFDVLWQEMIDILPTILIGILVLIGGWLFAKFLSKIVFRLLDRSKDSKLAKTLSLGDISERLQVEISFPLLISKVVYWVIFLFFIVGAAEIFGWHNVSSELSAFISYLPKVLSALLIFALGYTIANFLRNSVKSITKSMGIGLGNFIGEFLFYFLILIVSLTSMAQAGLDTTLISSQMYIIVGAASLTVVIALGLGAKEVVTDLLKNYYNRGVLNEGDWVRYADLEGEIDQITKTSVIIKSASEKVVIPAKDFYASRYTIVKQIS
jgi:hypothetical protein